MVMIAIIIASIIAIATIVMVMIASIVVASWVGLCQAYHGNHCWLTIVMVMIATIAIIIAYCFCASIVVVGYYLSNSLSW